MAHSSLRVNVFAILFRLPLPEKFTSSETADTLAKRSFSVFHMTDRAIMMPVSLEFL